MAKQMTRKNTLETALNYVTNDRNLDNGDPEDNFLRIAFLWTFWLEEKYGASFDLTPTDVAMMSIMIKQARLLETETKHDNWIDIAGYAACGAETASVERDKLPLRDAERAHTDLDGNVRKFPLGDDRVWPIVELTEEEQQALDIHIEKEVELFLERRNNE